MNAFRPVLLTLAALVGLAVPGTAHAQFFQPPVSRSGTGDYRVAATGDLNGDGKTDLVALRIAAGEPSVWQVWLNDGNGNFSPTEALGPGVATTPTIADADGDGHADVLLLLTGAVRVLWGDGDGRFPTFTDVTLPVFSTAASVAVGNLNGDSYPDLALSHRSSPTGVTVRYGLGSRQFDTPLAIADVAWAGQVMVANIDGDSMADLLVLVTPPAALGYPSVRALRAAAGFAYDGHAVTITVTLTGSLVVAMTAADVNADGLTEAVVVAAGTSVTVIDYSSGSPSPHLFPAEPAVIPPAVTDVDGDGRADIVVAWSASTSAAVFLAQADGTFSATPTFPIASLTPRWAVFGDVDGDGALDIIAGGANVPSGALHEIFALTLHVPPLRISASGASAIAGSNGTASVVVEAAVDSGHADVSFSWFSSGAEALGTGARLTRSLPIGVHEFTVRASTPEGLKAVATALVTVSAPPPPASETTVQAIQTTLDNKLDVTLSSRASQQSLTETHNALLSLNAYVLTQLDVPVSSRASTADVSAVGAKVDQLQTLLPTTSSLAALTQAVNELRTSLSASQARLSIELALARGEMIAAYYLPTAHGGQLDLVRSVVIDVADKNGAAGATDLDRARRLITEGDEKKTLGDYRGAYRKYADAYQAIGR